MTKQWLGLPGLFWVRLWNYLRTRYRFVSHTQFVFSFFLLVSSAVSLLRSSNAHKVSSRRDCERRIFLLTVFASWREPQYPPPFFAPACSVFRIFLLIFASKLELRCCTLLRSSAGAPGKAAFCSDKLALPIGISRGGNYD